jgi:ubiquinone/menaquinone biosynthesis C-methylase UbiE
MTETTGWNSFARVNASARWRKQSAAMGGHLTKLIVHEADVHPGMHVLDVASGTGEPAISIATQLNGTGHVIASDISSEPLNVGQDRAQQRGLTNIRFEHADVHQLPFSDGDFDRVTSRLGLMFFSDLSKALREIHRVLKPGGRLTAVAWGPMEQPYFQTTVGTVLRLIRGITIPPSAAALFKFAEPRTIKQALDEAGFHDVRAELRTVEWNWQGTAAEVWEYFQQVTIPFAPLLNSIPPERRPETDQAVCNAIEPLKQGDELHFNGVFVLVTASK